MYARSSVLISALLMSAVICAVNAPVPARAWDDDDEVSGEGRPPQRHCGFDPASKQCGGPCPDLGDVCLPRQKAKERRSGNPHKNRDCPCQPGPANTPTAVFTATDTPSPTAEPSPTPTEEPTPASCGFDPTAGQCGGACPSESEICLPSSENNCTCVLINAPCGPDPSSGLCVGFCPFGFSCGAAFDTCGCVPGP